MSYPNRYACQVMDEDKLYELVDRENDMTDQEKREAYLGEIEDDRIEQEWKDSFM